MPNQLFKKDIPISILFELFDQICEKKENYYSVNQDAYKKMFFHNLQDNFCEQIKEYYHSSKLFYVTRKLSYNSFINIVRQICKYNNIGFTYYVKYCDYKYNIFYNVYF
tara:strand:+ start:39 stop:365 length:327 start_codon:yes stop_codon:yes gene_type:complete